MKKQFVIDDLDILNAALELHPTLFSATHLVYAARKIGISYPLKGVDDLKPIFEKFPTFGSLEIEFEQAKKFIPPKFFPIESEDELLARALMAFSIGENSHALDRKQNFHDDTEYEIIPGPSATHMNFDSLSVKGESHAN